MESGEVLLGGMLMELIRPALVKIYKHAGFDFIYTDNEHVLFSGLPEMAAFVQLARDNGMPIISKCPQLDRVEVARLLEAGVTGIQLPRTESRADIETLNDFMRFPPVGSRAGAPILGNVDYVWPNDVEDWMAKANEATLVVGHLETSKGLEHIEEITSTPGLDMLYVGPLDFSISLGHPGNFDHPQVREAMMHVLDHCRKNNVAFGTTAGSIEAAREWVASGARFFEVVDELSLLHQGAARMVDTYREFGIVN